jgi:hypothetical protein
VRVGLLGTLEVTVGGEPGRSSAEATPLAVEQGARGVARRVAATADRLGVALDVGVDLGA